MTDLRDQLADFDADARRPILLRSIKDIGAVLRRRREQRGHTLLGMSVRLGTGRTRVSEWEHGLRTPNAATLIRYANALGYDLALIPREDT